LPVNLGDVFEEFAVNILATQAGFLRVIVNRPIGEVAIDTMSHHTALGGVMRRPNPSLRGVRVDMASLVAELVRGCGNHPRFARQENSGADANSYPDEKQIFIS
jgi:hypothetical protein